MTIGFASPALPQSEAGPKRVAVRYDVNLLLANDVPLFEATETLGFYRALFIAKDIQGLTVAPQVAIWADGVPLTGYSTLDGLNAANESVEIFSTQSSGINQAVPVIAAGDVVMLKNSGVAAADVMVCDVVIYAVELD
jgi:hypothetical protein